MPYLYAPADFSAPDMSGMFAMQALGQAKPASSIDESSDQTSRQNVEAAGLDLKPEENTLGNRLRGIARMLASGRNREALDSIRRILMTEKDLPDDIRQVLLDHADTGIRNLKNSGWQADRDAAQAYAGLFRPFRPAPTLAPLLTL